MSIITEYPLWLSIFCLAVGFAAAWILYNKSTDLDEAPSWVRKMLFVVRLVAVSIVALLLLSPLVERKVAKKILPKIVFAQDNSESIILGKDSAALRKNYIQKVAKLRNELGSDYDFVVATFGNEVQYQDSFSFNEKYSDYDQLLSRITADYVNDNLGALIVAGDGIFTKGIAPRFRAVGAQSPIYAVALGDTTRKRDLKITEVVHNRTAFVDTEVPIELYYEAFDLAGRTAALQVFDGGKVIFEKTIKLNQSQFSGKEKFTIKAGKAGVHFYKFSFKPLEGEELLKNNSKTIAIDVIKNKEKILLLSAGAHPDLGAIKQSIESNVIYEAKVWTDLSKFPKFSDYKLIILYQLPNRAFPELKLQELKKTNTSLLFIVGAGTDMRRFNRLNSILKIQTRANYAEATYVYNGNFSLFTTQEIASLFEQNPPLRVPFGSYKVQKNASVLLHQRQRGIETSLPILAFGKSDKQKQAVWVGEGLWRLRMDAFRKDNQHRKFDLLINKTVQYLSIQEQKERFVLRIPTISDEGTNIVCLAELYNESFEQVNDPAVRVSVTDSAGNQFDYLLEQYGTRYRLNLGTFPVGEYRYTAKAEFPDKSLHKSGKFSVRPMNLEAVNTVADFNGLAEMAESTGGKIFTKDSFDALTNAIKQDERIKPVMVENQKLTNITHVKAIFFLLLILLTLEWGLRKFFGSY